ncbi:putative adenosine deaminase family protein [Eutypa lata UCREL1]|uniref:adenosine deaminase n=1 Tax=Eutypa lata (strain UCR-EL1) TaxID=1287681 RepID=M7SMR3_EUTLA|nr:putative adenosine deaminase family protein [Eutypa lata UCREL1]
MDFVYNKKFTDEEWAEISQEIPKEDDVFLQKYLEGRENLIAQENKQRSGWATHPSSANKPLQNLSPIAQKACDIVARVRDEESRTIWTPQLEDSLARSEENITVHPGMMFSLSKQRMESTKLWKIVREMPKGALLHGHMDAMVDFDYLFGVLMDTPGMHILSDRPLDSPGAQEIAKVQFRFLKHARTDGDVWVESYTAATPILLTQAADAFPDGGRSGFLRWHAVAQHHGVDEIWAKFGRCFRIVNSIVHYEPIWRAFLRRLMSLLAADGVRWAELRFSWALDFFREGREEPEADYVAMMDILDEEVEAFKKSEAGKDGRFWGLRVIWATIRFFPTRDVIQDMDNAITTKMTHPRLIAGYDMVGQEDAGRPLRDLLPELFWFRKQCADEGVNMPFFFHAGECLGTGNSTDRNLFDAVLLGTRRIGHGFSLYKHPLLVDLVKEKKILVESCPISNEVLRLCGSVMSHPLPALLARGVACSLCNDDPAMLGQDTAGSTHDFWQALQGWESLGLAGLGSLAENSVRWAAFEDQKPDEWSRDVREASLGSGVKAARLQEWRVEWERFCLWVVTEFGDDEEGEGE